ncbi:TPA: hypothetical protein ACGPOM_000186 [Yersinia enterocolitica]
MITYGRYSKTMIPQGDYSFLGIKSEPEVACRKIKFVMRIVTAQRSASANKANLVPPSSGEIASVILSFPEIKSVFKSIFEGYSIKNLSEFSKMFQCLEFQARVDKKGNLTDVKLKSKSINTVQQEKDIDGDVL